VEAPDLQNQTVGNTGDDTDSAQASIVIRARADDVWRALTAGRKDWWPDLEFDSVVGAVVRETWDEDDGQHSAIGSVSEVVPKRVIAFEWSEADWPHPLEVRIVLDDHDDLTEVTVVETGFDALVDHPELRHAHEDSWHFHLGNLADAARTAAAASAKHPPD
jgi:uncharacterized protein YndB with AHSA1/START domain